MPTIVGQGMPLCVPAQKARWPIAIVIDRSQSTNRHRERMLAGIADLEHLIYRDPDFGRIAETAVVAFGDVEVLQSFRHIRHPGTIYMGWGTACAVAPALERTIELIAERRRDFTTEGVRVVFRPLIVLVTDGMSGETAPASLVIQGAQRRSIAILPVATPGTDPSTLQGWGTNPPVSLRALVAGGVPLLLDAIRLKSAVTDPTQPVGIAA